MRLVQRKSGLAYGLAGLQTDLGQPQSFRQNKVAISIRGIKNPRRIREKSPKHGVTSTLPPDSIQDDSAG